MLFDQIDEFIKKVAAIVWARKTFRVVLYRKGRLTFYTNPFNGVIIQVYVCNFNMRCIAYSLRIYTKAMVLCCDLTFTSDQVLNWMIHPSVAMVHLKRRNIVC